ncbi:MAG: universal stress protein [Pseudobdellovibrio sp.]
MNLPIKHTNTKNLLIWAFDPNKKPENAKTIIKELKLWAKHLHCDIQPVSVFSRSAIAYPLELAFSTVNDFKSEAKKKADQYLKKSGVKGFLPVEIIYINSQSNLKMAKEVTSFAERKNALLIIANTHAKKTWNPFQIGGFAETLTENSKIPVLLLNPTTIVSSKIPTILYPTNFSAESKTDLLKQVGPIAKSFNSQVLLFTQVETPNVYPAEFYGAWRNEAYNMESMVENIEKNRMKKAKQWLSISQKNNLNCLALVQRQKTNLADEIISVAKKNKANLIVLTNHNPTKKQKTLSRVVKDVLVQAKCPVLIFARPKEKEKHILKISSVNNFPKYITQKNANQQSREVSHA